MPDDITIISDLALDVEKVNSYAFQVTTEKSALIESGIMERNATNDELASSVGQIVNMPYWNDLTGDDEVLPTNGTTKLELDDISTGLDKAVINHRGKAFGVQDLVKELAKTMKNDPNADPMGFIAERLGGYWSRKYQNVLLSILKGTFSVATMAALINDVSGESTAATRTINSNTLIDSEGKLGDAGYGLAGLLVHSAAERKMRKDDLIDYIPASDGKSQIAMYQGKRVIVDDALAPVGDVYTSYLFGNGAIAYGEDTNPQGYPLLETDRQKRAGVDELISRRKFLLHPRGVKFLDAVCSGVSPTNAEFENASNWVRAYDVKNIRIVQFKHKIV